MPDEHPGLPGVSEHQLQVDGWIECCGLPPEPQQFIVPALLDVGTLSGEARHVLVVVVVVAVGVQVVTPEPVGPQPLADADGSDEVPFGCTFEHDLRLVFCLVLRQRRVFLLHSLDGNLSIDVFAAPVSNPLRPPLLKVKHSEARPVGRDVVLNVVLGQLVVLLHVDQLRQALIVHLASVFIHVGEEAEAVGVEYGDALVGCRLQCAADKMEVGEVEWQAEADVAQLGRGVPHEVEGVAGTDGRVCPR